LVSAEETKRFDSVNALDELKVWGSNINGDIEEGDYITSEILTGSPKNQ